MVHLALATPSTDQFASPVDNISNVSYICPVPRERLCWRRMALRGYAGTRAVMPSIASVVKRIAVLTVIPLRRWLRLGWWHGTVRRLHVS